jgi:hypothetical protein
LPAIHFHAFAVMAVFIARHAFAVLIAVLIARCVSPSLLALSYQFVNIRGWTTRSFAAVAAAATAPKTNAI